MHKFFQFVVILAGVLILLKCFSFDVCAKDLIFSVDSDVDIVSEKSDATITVKAKSVEKVKNISTFKFVMNFDKGTFQYRGISPSENFSKEDFRAHVTDNELIVVYLTSSVGFDVTRSDGTEIFNIYLRAIKPVPDENLSVRYKIDGIGDYNANRLNGELSGELHFDVTDKDFCDCRLKTLEPNVNAALEPDFSMDVYDYTLHVEPDVKSVKFSAEPADPNATVHQKKKKLNKAGETTEIFIDVCAKNKKCKKTYKVNVVRGEGLKSTHKAKLKNNSKNEKIDSKDENYEIGDDFEELKAQNPNSKNGDFDNQRLVVKENGFNIIIFIIIMLVCIVLWIVIAKKPKKKNQKVSDLKD